MIVVSPLGVALPFVKASPRIGDAVTRLADDTVNFHGKIGLISDISACRGVNFRTRAINRFNLELDTLALREWDNALAKFRHCRGITIKLHRLPVRFAMHCLVSNNDSKCYVGRSTFRTIQSGHRRSQHGTADADLPCCGNSATEQRGIVQYRLQACSVRLHFHQTVGIGHRHRGQNERQMDNDLPHHGLLGQVGCLDKGLQQVDGGNANQ
jgi:hypothetical protein